MADLADHANDLMLERLESLLSARQREAEPSAMECIDCGDPIPSARRLAAPGCCRCLDCQAMDELERRG
ncbi:MAG: Protein TraR [Pseudomonas citronellolis]|nr:MAG: Protein TraR [Pseudomonas citronellolis]